MLDFNLNVSINLLMSFLITQANWSLPDAFHGSGVVFSSVFTNDFTVLSLCWNEPC